MYLKWIYCRQHISGLCFFSTLLFFIGGINSCIFKAIIKKEWLLSVIFLFVLYMPYCIFSFIPALLLCVCVFSWFFVVKYFNFLVIYSGVYSTTLFLLVTMGLLLISSRCNTNLNLYQLNYNKIQNSASLQLCPHSLVINITKLHLYKLFKIYTNSYFFI